MLCLCPTVVSGNPVWLYLIPVEKSLVLKMVAGTVRKSKCDIVLSNLAASLYTEWQGHIGCSAIGWTRARGWADFQYSHSVNTPLIQKSNIKRANVKRTKENKKARLSTSQRRQTRHQAICFQKKTKNWQPQVRAVNPATITLLNVNSLTTAHGQQPSTSKINYNSTNKQDKKHSCSWN